MDWFPIADVLRFNPKMRMIFDIWNSAGLQHTGTQFTDFCHQEDLIKIKNTNNVPNSFQFSLYRVSD